MGQRGPVGPHVSIQNLTIMFILYNIDCFWGPMHVMHDPIF
jgi:hypothetical protein